MSVDGGSDTAGRGETGVADATRARRGGRRARRWLLASLGFALGVAIGYGVVSGPAEAGSGESWTGDEYTWERLCAEKPETRPGGHEVRRVRARVATSKGYETTLNYAAEAVAKGYAEDFVIVDFEEWDGDPLGPAGYSRDDGLNEEQLAAYQDELLAEYRRGPDQRASCAPEA